MESSPSKTIDSLSDEIVEMILDHLNDGDLRNVLLTNKKFHRIICESLKLMKKFELQWMDITKKEGAELVKSERKYRNLAVCGVNKLGKSLRRFILAKSFSLTSFSFSECELKLTDIQIVLNSSANIIENFSLHGVSVTADSEAQPIKLPKIENLGLSYSTGDGYASVMPFFMNAPVKSFQYEDTLDLSKNFDEIFLSVLLSFTRLEELSVFQHLVNVLFSTSTFTDSAKFRCKKLYLWVNALDSPNASFKIYDNIFKFLKKQQNSLEIFTMCSSLMTVEMLQTILSLRLKDLRLVSNTFIPDDESIGVVNNSIEKILISCPENVFNGTDSVICDLLRCCRNLKNLSFVRLNVNFEISMVIAYEMKFLDTLDFFDSNLMPITYPRVKKLFVKMCEEEEIIRLIRVNRQLENLEVPESLQNNQNFARALEPTSISCINYCEF